MEHHDRGRRHGDAEIDQRARQHTCADPCVDTTRRLRSAWNYLVYVGGAATALIFVGFSVSANLRDGFLVLGYAIGAVAAVGFSRSFAIAVLFDPDRLTVRTPLHTRRVAWVDIAEIAEVPRKLTPRSVLLRLRLRDGSPVSLQAFAVAKTDRLRHVIERERAAHAPMRSPTAAP